ncbi:MAG: hypothetical protein IJU37_07345 [Desulfovibrio sp.]|nr:hypothetical protein [Desulfovibrio sp.]
MRYRSLLKVYGHIHPADATLFSALKDACAAALPDNDDIPLLEQEGDLVRISFEGAFFPVEEVLAAVQTRLLPEHQGKLDVLDMDAWRLVRHVFRAGRVESRSGSLNQVLEYSGH